MTNKCPNCGAHELADAVVDRTTRIQYDGTLHSVRVPNLEVMKCGACGEIVLDNRADKQYVTALRKMLNLLQPHEIRESRLKLKLTQAALANLLGVAAESLSRWENGHVIQSRAHNKFLKAYFAVPELREHIAPEWSAAFAWTSEATSSLVIDATKIFEERGPPAKTGACAPIDNPLEYHLSFLYSGRLQNQLVLV